MSFKLDKRLGNDTVEIGDLSLCCVLLFNDFRYPWLILVTKKPGLKEIDDLSLDDRILLAEDTYVASRVIRELYSPLKLNIGSLGNVVRQLHVHVVGRRECDPAWPGPVWGHSPREPYDMKALKIRKQQILDAITRHNFSA